MEHSDPTKPGSAPAVVNLGSPSLIVVTSPIGWFGPLIACPPQNPSYSSQEFVLPLAITLLRKWKSLSGPQFGQKPRSSCERYTKTMIVLSPAVSLVPGLRFVLYSLPKDIFMWFSSALATKHH